MELKEFRVISLTSKFTEWNNLTENVNYESRCAAITEFLIGKDMPSMKEFSKQI